MVLCTEGSTLLRKGSHAERNLHRWVKMLFGNPLTMYSLWLDLDSQTDTQRVTTEVPTLPIWEIMHALWKVTRKPNVPQLSFWDPRPGFPAGLGRFGSVHKWAKHRSSTDRAEGPDRLGHCPFVLQALVRRPGPGGQETA